MACLLAVHLFVLLCWQAVCLSVCLSICLVCKWPKERGQEGMKVHVHVPLFVGHECKGFRSYKNHRNQNLKFES